MWAADVQPNGTVRHVHCLGEEIVETQESTDPGDRTQDLTPHVMMEQIAHDR
jgi:hypothetical protein